MLAHLESLTVLEALMVALSGMVVVFLMLGILSLLILVVSRFVSSMDGKAAATKSAAAPAAKPAAPAAAAPAATQQDEGELAAVIMAAIAAETDSSPDSFRIAAVQAR